MFLKYNGIEFKMLRIEEWTTEEVYEPEAVEYVMDRHQITAICILNRDLNDAGRFPPLPPVPGRLPAGKLVNQQIVGPAGTVPAIEARVRSPRKKLQIYSYTNPQEGVNQQFMIDAPKDGYRTDAKFGPQCTGFQVIPTGGFGSYSFRMQFVTWINKCEPKPTTSQSQKGNNSAGNAYVDLILSNRWAMRVTTTDDYYPIQIAKGMAIVRQDEMLKLGIDARDLINNLFYIPAPGWRRLPVEVEVNGGGDRIDYEITDVYMPSNFVGGAPFFGTRAEVMESKLYSRPQFPATESLLRGIGKGILDFLRIPHPD